MKSNLSISHNTDQITASEAIIIDNLVQRGYIHTIEEMSVKYKDYVDLISTLQDHYALVKHDFSESIRNIFIQYESDEVVLFCFGNARNMYITAHSKTLDISSFVFQAYKHYYKEETEVKIYMTTFYMNSGRLDSTLKTIDTDDINKVKNEYYPYINTDIMYEQFLTLDENILILAGAPGIGKTVMANSILKYCTENVHTIPYDKMKEDSMLEQQFLAVCYVKSTDVLADDAFWRELQKNEFDFVILDDLDYMLTTRSAEVSSHDDVIKNKFINQFLSFTSGIESNKTKFIITTNQNVEDVDLALLRKGRLFDILQLRSLKRQEALVIWKLSNLSEEEFYNLYNTDNILPADLGSDIAKYLNSNTSMRIEYLLEDGISYSGKTQKSVLGLF